MSAQQYGSFDPAGGKVVESMAFFHIALPEMKEALLPYLDENGLGEVPARFVKALPARRLTPGSSTR